MRHKLDELPRDVGEMGDDRSIQELARLHTRCVGVFLSLFTSNKTAGILYVQQIAAAKRFTWGRDDHKTFEERPGYDCVALNLWFLFRFLIIALVTVLFHSSGGLLARYWQLWVGRLMYWPANLLQPLFDTIQRAVEVIAVDISQGKGTLGVAPMWVARYASLSIVHHLLGLVEDILWLNRSLTRDSSKQHDHWTKWDTIAAFWSLKLSCSSSRCRHRAPGRCADISDAICTELERVLLQPSLAVARMFASLFVSSCAMLDSIRTMRMHPAFAPRSRLLCLSLRLGWLILLSASFGAIDRSSAARVVFACLAAIQAWSSILVSVAEACLSRVGPTDLLCGRISANTLFGWYYDWWEQGHSAWKPRERRPLRNLMNGSLFWVLTFVLKISVEYTATSTIVPSASTFVSVIQTMLQQGQFLFALAASIGLVLRLGFTLLFFLADLQLFFAASMAIVGGLTVARTVDCSALGSLWDRSDGLGEQHWLEAARGVLRRFPPAITQVAQDKTSEVGSLSIEIQLLRALWNDGLLPDLQRSHLINANSAALLQIQSGANGGTMFPALSSLMPTLCADARRRIYTVRDSAKLGVLLCTLTALSTPCLLAPCTVPNILREGYKTTFLTGGIVTIALPVTHSARTCLW